MLVLMDEEGVVLVVVNYLRDCGERKVSNHVLAFGGWVDVKVFATAHRERGGEREEVRKSIYKVWLNGSV